MRKIVDGEKFLKDTNNHYAFVGQQRYKGKYDENGQEVVPTGVKVTPCRQLDLRLRKK